MANILSSIRLPRKLGVRIGMRRAHCAAAITAHSTPRAARTPNARDRRIDRAPAPTRSTIQCSPISCRMRSQSSCPRCSMNHVHNVGAVKALPARDEQLGYDQLLCRQNLYRGHREPRCRLARSIQSLLHHDHAVAHAGDEVHESNVRGRALQSHTGSRTSVSKSSAASSVQRAGNFLVSQKEIEVFGVAPDSSVLMQRKRSAHRKRNALARGKARAPRRTEPLAPAQTPEEWSC